MLYYKHNLEREGQMGTRSTIAMKKPEGGVVAIYCHWDGYPAHNGDILNKHWTDTDKIAQLIGLGDLSSLGTELGEKQDFDNRQTQSEDWCLAYGRDRGEKDIDARHYPDVQAWIESKKNSWCEWAYLWDGQDWLVHQIKDEETDYPVFDFADVVLLQHQKEIAEMAK